MLKIFGLPISDISYSETIDQIKTWLKEAGQHLIVTANPEILLKAKENKDYWHVLNKASLRVPDGAGIILISYLTNSPLHKKRVRGVDLVERLLKDSLLNNLKLYMVGSSEEILSKVSAKFGQKVGYAAGPFFKDWEKMPLNDSVNDDLIKKINDFKPEVLLVGFGAPKQERWIDYYLSQLSSVKVAIGVGGSFDYIGDKLKRAPNWMQQLGLEWVWRLILEPKRLIRILMAVVVFPISAFINRQK